MSRNLTRLGLSMLALAIMLVSPGFAHAQRITPARIDAVPRVELAPDFERIERYNAHVNLANAARTSIPRLQRTRFLNAAATLGFLGLTAQQYLVSEQKMGEGDGTGWEAPAMVASLSVGGAIWTGIKWLESHWAVKEAKTSEQQHLRAARQAFPGRDPAGAR